jgi:uncharacterized protein with NRDE domain
VCLIVLARDLHPDYPLILLAHRDEFVARPTTALHWWPGSDILAGRDDLAGGSWLGLSRRGRFAAVTNVRQGPPEASARSRGELVTDWLSSSSTALDSYAAPLAAAAQYSGFNLLFGGWFAGETAREASLQLHYVSNRFAPRPVPTGISALSNGEFDAPWPKVRRAKQQLARLLGSGEMPTEHWLDVLAHPEQANDAELPDTGIGLARERWLSPSLITGPHYGTRAASLLTLRRDGEWWLLERTLDPAAGGALVSQSEYRIPLV